MAKKTGVKNITDTIDNKNKTGSDDNTDPTVRRPPKKRSRVRKKTGTQTLPPALPELPDEIDEETAEETPAELGPEEPALSDDPTAALPPEEDFTLSDFISSNVILELKPVLEKESVVTKKNTPEKGQKQKNNSKIVLETEPVLKKESDKEEAGEQNSKGESANTEPVIETEPASELSSEIEQDIKKEPVTLTIPNTNAEQNNALEENPIPVAKKEPIPAKADYAGAEYPSVQAMASLKGFAPLGMLFILMDVLNGAEEGLIRVNRLAKALSIGKPAMLAQLENLERAGLIRTTSSSQQGRHIELLIPNRVICESSLERNAGAQIVSGILPQGMPQNFSLQKMKELQNFLTEHGVQLVALPDESGLDPRLSQIAAFLGKYLSCVQPFYTRLKATLNVGEEIQFPLLGFQGRDVTHTLNFCKMLKNIGFLAAFTYRRAPHYTIVARLARTPAAINFLSGGWLEHYIRDKVVSIVTTHPSTLDTPFAFMKNPRIVLPGDEDFEFDFLMLIGSSVFWIEAKTGEYMDYLAKYSRVSKLLNLNRNSNLLVLVDAPKPDANISARYGISCCSVDEFPEVFRLAMVRELARAKRV